ncbi:MAG: hypothetical protein QXP81_02190 [Nitrososphaerota archaeon]
MGSLAPVHWVVAAIVTVMVGLNTLFWGLAVREVGEPALSVRFLVTLFFNRWFILAMLTGFAVAVLSYWVYNILGVMLGRFFLSSSIAAMILVGYFVLKEPVSASQWIGVLLILMGALLIGRV